MEKPTLRIGDQVIFKQGAVSYLGKIFGAYTNDKSTEWSYSVMARGQEYLWFSDKELTPIKN